MSERVSKLVSEQAALIRECRGEIESSKLSIWQFKAEYDDLLLQLARAEKRLVDNESQYARLINESKRLGKELSAVGESFSKDHCKSLLTISGKTTLMLDLAEALCTMCGFSERNWDFFRVTDIQKLLKEYRTLSESLRNFDSSCIDKEELTRVEGVTKTHQLEKMVKSGAVADEVAPLVAWLLLAVQEVQQEHSATAISLKLPLLANDKNEIYTQTKELEDNIHDLESKLERLLECIDAAERNIRKLQEAKDPSADEIEETEHQCKQLGMLARRNVGMDNIISHMAKSEEFKAFRELDQQEKVSSSTALVNSLYISHAISPQLQGQLKSILESQAAPPDDLNESSVDHTETLQVPKASPEFQSKPPPSDNKPTVSDSKPPQSAVKASPPTKQQPPRNSSQPVQPPKAKRRKNKCCGFV